MTWHEPARLALEVARVAHIETGEHYLIAQCDHATLAAALRAAGVMVDALIVDAPYSERTHAGHDGGAALGMSARGADYRSRVERPTGGTGERRALDYAAWAPSDAAAFVGQWHALVRGWLGSLTDHVLAPAWATAMGAAYRYAFSPLACIESGSRCRLGGDGPSQWATWLVVSRPRTREFQSWGTLPGAYMGTAERKDVTGGKPLWLMRAIVGDYSAPGDLVCDPCAGAGTTLVAAVELGRRAIGCEPDNVTINEKGERIESRFQIACRRLAKARPQLRMRLDVEAVRGEQSALALGGEE